MFIIFPLERSSCFSSVFPPAMWTNDVLNTASVKFTDLANVLYAKIFVMLLVVLQAISTLIL